MDVGSGVSISRIIKLERKNGSFGKAILRFCEVTV
jgi:hypothetical protein